jgi:hypothetical protein
MAAMISGTTRAGRELLDEVPPGPGGGRSVTRALAVGPLIDLVV